MKTYMLTPFQRMYYEYWKQDPEDDSLNIVHTEQLPADVNAETFAAEVKRLANQIIVLHSRIVEVEDEPRLVFDMNMEIEVCVRYLSDEEADEVIRHQPIRFNMNQGPMTLYQVLVTPTRKFLKTATGNIIFDGWSFTVFGNGVVLAAMNHNECINHNLNTFPAYLEKLEEMRRSPRFETDRKWWIEYMKGTIRLTDFAIKDEYESGRLICKRRIFNRQMVDASCQKLKLPLPECMLATWALSLKDMTGDEIVSFITTNRGRTHRNLEAIGNYLVEKAMRIDFSNDDTPMDVLERIRHANFVTNLHSLFTEQDLEPYIGNSDRGTCVLFNEDIDHTQWEVNGQHPKILFQQSEETSEFLSGILWGRKDKYELEVSYSEPLYRETDVERFMKRFEYWFNEILK